MIKNLNSIRNIIKDIEKDSDEYMENGIAFMGLTTDTNTHETSMGYIGNAEDFFYMIGCACVTFYKNSQIEKTFKENEFVDYLCDRLKETFKQIGNKKKHKSRG